MGGGVSTAKLCKEKYEAKLEIPGGWESSNKKPSIGAVCIFCGATQYVTIIKRLHFLMFDLCFKALNASCVLNNKAVHPF